MDDRLLDLVIDRLDASNLPERTADLVLAACESDRCLAAVLGGEPATEPLRSADRAPGASPAGAHLRSITVQAFRGISGATTLPLAPGPGLTIVTGRNGSGKSSFAEGLELLLTGRLRRWDDLSAVWREGWRNMHANEPTVLSAELDLVDAGPAEVRRTWDEGTALGDSTATVQVSGNKREDIARLGWAEDLAAYRPFLSHAELEAFFSGRPSQLYELLASVLGLDDLTETAARLASARLEREKALKAARSALPSLVERLATIDDERAGECREALGGRWDLDRVRAVVTGATPADPGGELVRLRHLAQLATPTQDQVTAAAARLTTAATDLDAVGGTDAARAAGLADLLRVALRHHESHGDGPCPVCGRESALDDDWRAQTEKEAARLEQDAAGARSAQLQAETAWAALRSIVQAPPAALLDETALLAEEPEARAAWQTWSAEPDREGPDALRRAAAHLTTAWPLLVGAVDSLRAAANDELAQREDRWGPAAAAIAAWCDEASRATSDAEAVPQLKAAERWLKGAIDDIRNDRFAPLAEDARAIWDDLRHESNVTLESIRLAGSGTSRQVAVDVEVDGAPCAGLGVMSQGEVNALALSVFLPRATMAESPFRFLVIDDPVQAMDAAKVDGLARVLGRAARDRQIVVFTHDNRLPEALRRLEITSTVLEVTRRPRSQVTVRLQSDPVRRALDDAHAVCSDRTLPAEVAARVVGGLCRMAVEATLAPIAHRRMFRSGLGHAEVDERMCRAKTLYQQTALAMYDDIERTSDILSRLNRSDRRLGDTFTTLNTAAHMPHAGNLRDLVEATDRLAERLRSICS